MRIRLIFGCLVAFTWIGDWAQADGTMAAPDFYPAPKLRICDTPEGGYFQIPGSEVCLKISGSVSYDLAAGDDVYTGEPLKRLDQAASATLGIETKSDLELGALHTYFAFDLGDPVAGGVEAPLADAVIELNGLKFGISSSQFDVWLRSAGNVLNDDVVAYAPGVTNQISFTTVFGNGLSAMLGAEQGEVRDQDNFVVHDRIPHLVAGLSLAGNGAQVATVVGYDSVMEETAAKVRLDFKLSDPLLAFLMVGYRSTPDKPSYFGAWEGRYAAWGGISLNLTPHATFNSQAAYAESGKYSMAANIDYEVVPGLLVTSELDYTSFPSDVEESSHALGGVVSIERAF